MIVRRVTPEQLAVHSASAAADLAVGPFPPSLYPAASIVLVADVRKQFYGGHDERGQPWRVLKFPRPQGGNRPLLNTAILANSYQADPDPKGIIVSSAHASARVHQDGAIIRPVRAKALTIPLTKEATRYGARRFPRPLFSFPGGAGLYERKGKGKKAKLIRHYLFCSKVVVPARPVGFSDDAVEQVGDLLLDFYAGEVI